MNGENNMETYTLPYIKQIINENLLFDSGNSCQGSVITYRGGMEREVGGRFKREGTEVYLQLIHGDVWQKPTKYYKAIILQLKINKIKNLGYKVGWKLNIGGDHELKYPKHLEVFSGGSVVKSLPASAGDIGSIPGLGRSLEKEMATHSVFLPGGFHGQRSLVGYSPQDCRVGHGLVTEQQQQQQGVYVCGCVGVCV